MPLVATHLIKKGAQLEAFLDMTPFTNVVRSAPWLPLALADTPLLLEGAKMLATIKYNKIPMHLNVESIAAHGTDHVEAISYRKGNKEFRIPTRTVLFHAGFIPRTHMARALRIEHTWNAKQHCHIAKFDIFGMSNLSNIHVIGDCAQVYGEGVASTRGILAGLKIAQAFGAISQASFKREYVKQRLHLLHALSPRNFIDSYFTPRKDLFSVPDNVIVCRCENICAGDIRKATLEGLADVNEVKLRTRAGMGICQGRTCGAAIAAIAADARAVPVESMGALSIRNPVRAIPTETILTLENTAEKSLSR